MANPDESDFVNGAMNATFSSAIADDDISSDFENNILHNISNEESSDDEQLQVIQQNIPGRPNPNEWSNVSDVDFGSTTPIPIYNVNSGPNLPSYFDADTLPIDYFLLFFNKN